MLEDSLAGLRKNHFVSLILDNEVTVGHFVTEPPLPWLRLIHRDGGFQIAPGYPTLLTATQAQFEMKNWDQVSLTGIQGFLGRCHDIVDFIVFGNNAGQGLPLAGSLPGILAPDRAAVVYASGLPEIKHYEQLGYQRFWRRDQAVQRLLELADSAGRPLALLLINTIQHNESNFHAP